MNAPVRAERIPIVDALRGWALLAVVLVNFGFFFNRGTDAEIPAGDTVSRFLDEFVQVFFESKGWTMLAFLFGYGFSVLIALLRERSAHPTRAYARRMFWLLAIALVNSALFYGDVLKDYALVGLVILLFQRIAARGALIVAVICTLAFPALIAWSHALALASPIPVVSIALYQSSSLIDVLTYGLLCSLRTTLTVTKYFDWDLVMLACAFAGVYCQRSGFFDRLVERRRRLLHLCLAALLVAGAAAGLHAAAHRLAWSLLRYYDTELWLPLAQMVCLMAGLCWMYAGGWLPGVFETLRLTGRMPLTNYLLQNLIGLLLFSGVGLGLLRRLPYSAYVLIALVVFVAQAWLSRWWLAHHALGPVEKLWRALSGLLPRHQQ